MTSSDNKDNSRSSTPPGWTPHPTLPNALLRPISNNERFFLTSEQVTGARTSIGASLLLDFDSPVEAQDLLCRLKKAWLYTRAQCPSLGFKVANAKEGSTASEDTCMLYEDLTSTKQAFEWAEQTVHVKHINDPSGTLDVRILEGHHEDPIVANTVDHHIECLIATSPAPRAWLRLWLDHNMMDGPSSRWLLAHLVKYLSLSPESLEIGWASESEQARIRSRLLPGSALPFLKPEYRDQVFDVKADPQKQFAAVTRQAFSTLKPFSGGSEVESSAAKTFTTRLKLSSDETRQARNFCHRHNVTVTALLLSTAVVRQTILRSEKWPLPAGDRFIGLFPVDSRPAWVESERGNIGLYTAYTACEIRTGSLFQDVKDPSAATPQQVRNAIVEGARHASEQYQWTRREPHRAQLCARTEQTIAEVLSAMAAGTLQVDALPFWLFSDGPVELPSLGEESQPQVGGLTMTIRDYDLLNNGKGSVWLRSWMWEGQTVMSLTEGDSGASRAEIDEMLRVWKEDMMNVVATATE